MMDTSILSVNESLFGGENRREVLTLLLISDEMHAVLTFSIGLTTAVISIIGIGANVVNLVTFAKMGFKDTINISLTALAAVDMASLVCRLWKFIYYIPPFYELLSDTIDVTKVDFITTGISKNYLTTVAGFITSLIAVERCLCVLKPLKVKVIFTKDRQVRVLGVIFILVMPPFLPLCFTSRLGWVFMPDKNRTVISLIRNRDLIHINGICFGIIVCQCISCFVIVFVSTLIIVWKLASQSAWRAGRTSDNAHAQQAHADGCRTGSRVASEELGTEKTKIETEITEEKSGAMSGRDRRATMTVTFIAAMYIVCSFPSVVANLAMAFVPEFNKGMRFNNVCDVVWAVVYVVEAISSSANILVYLKTSAKFREAFLDLFRDQ